METRKDHRFVGRASLPDALDQPTSHPRMRDLRQPDFRFAGRASLPDALDQPTSHPRMRDLLAAALALCLTLILFAAVAAQDDESIDQVMEIAGDLNCPTCNGINLADCRTETCIQWKEEIGDLVAEGRSKEEILDLFATRYGTSVLQNPPKEGPTLLLWLLPLAVLLVGGVWLWRTLRDWNQKTSGRAEPAVAVQAPDIDSVHLEQVSRDMEMLIDD